MRILFIGDVVGRSGRNAVLDRLPKLVAEWKLDLAVVNGENAAGGFGITEAIYNDLIDAGADAVTLGNHAWDQREALVFIERAPKLVRPLNYPPGTPGRGAALVDTKNGGRALVINAMGRIFIDPLDDPFAAVAREHDTQPLPAALHRTQGVLQAHFLVEVERRLQVVQCQLAFIHLGLKQQPPQAQDARRACTAGARFAHRHPRELPLPEQLHHLLHRRAGLDADDLLPRHGDQIGRAHV